MDKIIYAPDLVGNIERYEICADGFYHWHGVESYCGYTADELLARTESDIDRQGYLG